MIVLDTHIWVWWVHGGDELTKTQVKVIEAHESNDVGVSAISCWEIAKLVEYRRLELPCSLKDWFDQALSYQRANAGRITKTSGERNRNVHKNISNSENQLIQRLGISTTY